MNASAATTSEVQAKFEKSFRDYVSKQTYMSPEEAGKRWGRRSFTPQSFKRGDLKVRSQMAADLVLKKTFIGKPYATVEKELGRHDGFFWQDRIPAYLVEDDLRGGKESWQIVFLFDGDGVVRDILIHKQ